ncbi:flagellar basal body rod protein FlgB [Defluviitalea raffinosedens]|uniref:Flagellar basal body rod protein FlgB n=1 Tax=Defluviitalea raffinosedens TaxID=1450156 RepID=A0A7C8HHX6_9FIRM|nr:flagellar basal body rod protein FlgB [Defluviitalea raffinosedens]HHW67347.1 flagellar basal body rod protein FlgB [Candidatus Epulonipiscium sp.]
MFNRLYSNANVLEKALDASWLRNEAISNNIANADTPGYKRKDVEFEKYLEDAVAFNKSVHKININSIQPKIVTDNSSLQTRLDENNVDIDVEMTELAKNSIKYNTLISLVSKKFKGIDTVLNLK